MKRISERRMRQIIREEQQLNEFSFMDAVDTVKTAGKWFDGAKGYLEGIKKWLNKNQDYLIPVYNTVATMINDSGKYKQKLPLIGWSDEFEVGGIDPHTNRTIEDIDDTSEPGIIDVMIDTGKMVRYNFKDPKTGEIDMLKDPKITVESRKNLTNLLYGVHR